MKRLKGLMVAAMLVVPMVAFAGFTADDDVFPEKSEKVAKARKKAAPEPDKQPEAKAPPVVATPPKEEAKPVAATPAPVVAPAPVASVWVARAGSTLRRTIEDWGRIAGDWKVVWEPEDLDYPLPAQRSFEGTFEKVVTELFEPYRKARRPLLVDGWMGNRVIYVVEEK